MRRARHAIVASCATVLILVLAPGAHAVPSRLDPANIVGRWNYRTQSNCGSVEGVGWVAFAWDAGTSRYHEDGSVYWADSRSTITWGGEERYLPSKRRLEGALFNSLGDTVRGRWSLEGAGPDRLTLRWTQTNGCVGIGIATRAPLPSPP